MGATDGAIGTGAKVSGKVVGICGVEIAIPPAAGVGFTFCVFGFTTPGAIRIDVKPVVVRTTSFDSTGTFGVTPLAAGGITPIVGLGAICTDVSGTVSGFIFSLGKIAGVSSVVPPCSVGFSSTPTAHSSLGPTGVPANRNIIFVNFIKYFWCTPCI